jgi:hypothetical protein
LVSSCGQLARSRERVVLEVLDPAVPDGELVVGVVDVATGGLRGRLPHDPLQTGELSAGGGHVQAAEGVAQRLRVRLSGGHPGGEHHRSGDLDHRAGGELSAGVGEAPIAAPAAKPWEQQRLWSEFGNRIAS